ncbi:hypothetical protein ACFOQM_11565 [Paenibacillus sp. GCM10012307]|uniref:ComF family protein n=1 Tax=Paenibacillus roseus TaxID=2798579 RepID=A0A934J5H5_9BACL|nr:hypothetical protein [Paenibacillus roseus]MBJ6361923.1 hypothetical protein [Paenibacillus roseus]
MSWLLRAFFELLRPAYRSCRICGKMITEARLEGMAGFNPYARYVKNMLCLDCCGSVPWIETGQIRCHACGRSVPCEDCIRAPGSELVRNRSAVRYDEGMKALLARLKYRGDEAISLLLEAMLYPAFEHMTSDIHRLYFSHLDRRKHRFQSWSDSLQGSVNQASVVWDAITYVPISIQRAQERGFNQAQLLADGLAKRYSLPAIALLDRVRDTPKQSIQSRKARFHNTEALFSPVPEAVRLLQLLSANGSVQQGRHSANTIRILIMDDIYTTGSTLRACAKSLCETGVPVEVYSLTWARG